MENTKRAAIEAFMKAGYSLIPLRGKKPISNSWQRTKYGQHSAEELVAGNYGVVLGPDDLVVDVDPRNFKRGDDPLARLEKRIGKPLQSFTVLTGRDDGGKHIYFGIPPGVAVVNSLPDFPGLEFKSKGRQVVGPGSIHPDTKGLYRVIAGTPQSVIEAPAALVELIEKTPTVLP